LEGKSKSRFAFRKEIIKEISQKEKYARTFREKTKNISKLPNLLRIIVFFLFQLMEQNRLCGSSCMSKSNKQNFSN